MRYPNQYKFTTPEPERHSHKCDGCGKRYPCHDVTANVCVDFECDDCREKALADPAESLIRQMMSTGRLEEGFGAILYNYYGGMGPGASDWRPMGAEGLADVSHDMPDTELDMLFGKEWADAIREVRKRS